MYTYEANKKNFEAMKLEISDHYLNDLFGKFKEF